MQKRIIGAAPREDAAQDFPWLNIESIAEAEITSEDIAHPLESALSQAPGSGWRAAEPGKQTIRLLFAQPQKLRRIRLSFEETLLERTQEYVLSWSPNRGQSFHEIVRQQWNFSPGSATTETEDHRVELSGVTALELTITPDISGKNAFATLAHLQIA